MKLCKIIDFNACYKERYKERIYESTSNKIEANDKITALHLKSNFKTFLIVDSEKTALSIQEKIHG